MYCTVPFVQNTVMNNTKGCRSGYSDMYEFSGSGSIGSDQAFVNLILYRFLKEKFKTARRPYLEYLVHDFNKGF